MTSVLAEEVSKQGCCCAFHSRRCMRLFGLRFLLHVSPGAPPTPEASARCCCNRQQPHQQQQMEDDGATEIADDGGPAGRLKKACTPESHPQQQQEQQQQRPQQYQQQQQQDHQQEALGSGTGRDWGACISSSSSISGNRQLRACSTAMDTIQQQQPKPHPIHQNQQKQRKHQQGQREFRFSCRCGCKENRIEGFTGQSTPAAPPPPRFTPVFSKDVPRLLVSVNAGDPRLYVGGGSINLAFLSAINDFVSRAKTRGPSEGRRTHKGHQRGPQLDFALDIDPDWGEKIAELHAAVLEAARGTHTGTAALRYRSSASDPIGGEGSPQESLLRRMPISGLFALVPTKEETTNMHMRETDGFVCLSLLRDELRETGDHSLGMLYVVGPKAWHYSPRNFYGARKNNSYCFCCCCCFSNALSNKLEVVYTSPAAIKFISRCSCSNISSRACMSLFLFVSVVLSVSYREKYTSPGDHVQL